MVKIKSIKILFISALLFVNLSAIDIKELPKDLTLSKALYNHCLELTQSQQLLKLYILTNLNSTYKSPKKTLEDAIPKYGKRLKILHKFFDAQFKEEKNKQSFSEGVEIWENSIKPKLLAKPTKENTIKLKKDLAIMYKKLKATKALKKKGKNQTMEAVKMTGGICYGSQDMATLYLMAKAQGVDMPDYKEQMQKRMLGFKKKLNTLKSLEINTSEIKDALNKAEKAYSYFVFMYDPDRTVIASLIRKKADEIFQKIESVKKLYGKLLKGK